MDTCVVSTREMFLTEVPLGHVRVNQLDMVTSLRPSMCWGGFAGQRKRTGLYSETPYSTKGGGLGQDSKPLSHHQTFLTIFLLVIPRHAKKNQLNSVNFTSDVTSSPNIQG